MARRPVIVDTDPGIDDAIAITLLLHEPSLDIKLFTTVAGNVGIEHTTDNVLRLQKMYGTSIPVARGSVRPLLHEFKDASSVHGETGMGGYDFPEGDTSLALKEHAVEAIRKVLEESDEKVTILTLGPFTNMALFIRMYPEYLEKIEEIIVMGGAYGRGNVGPMVEFNAGVDPEATKIVLESNLKLTVVGLDIGRQATITKEEAEEHKDESDALKMVYGMLHVYRSDQTEGVWEMYDPTAAAYLIHPEFFKAEVLPIKVLVDSDLAYGQTVIDLKNQTGWDTKANIAITIDHEKFNNWLFGTLKDINRA